MPILIYLLMFVQGIPASTEAGRISGILRTEVGKPASGVRVSARPSSADGEGTLVSLTETDGEGRFVLESVPPGQYYIVAGSVDMPTFYPGVLSTADAHVIEISAGVTHSGMDFPIQQSSIPRAAPAQPPFSGISVPVSVTLQVTLDGGGELPASDGRPAPMIHFEPVAGGSTLQTSLEGSAISVPVRWGVTEEYRVRIDNLPDGYVVKSITSNSRDLTTDTLRVSSPNPTIRIVTYTGRGRLQEIVDEASRKITREVNTVSVVLGRKQAEP